MPLPPEERRSHQQEEEQTAPPPGPPPSTDAQFADTLIQKILPAPSAQDWAGRSVEDRQEYLFRIQKLFDWILEELFDEGNRCVGIVKTSMSANQWWRFGLISLTGCLAILNLLAAYYSKPSGLPLAAAIYAAGLAILTNLESFFNYPGKAQAYRDSRDLFVDAYRDFEMLWNTRVHPFGDRPEACVNAAEAYRLLVERDREIRGKVRELTTAKKPKPDAKPANHASD